MTKKRPGKDFEADFIKSVPDRCDVTRLKDGGGWSNATNMRFTSKNPCDFIVWNGCGRMYKLELKSVAGKSMPYSNIKQHQFDSLWESEYKLVDARFVINFRGVNETYTIKAIAMMAQKNNSTRKSLSLAEAREIGELIPQTKKITRWRYDLEWL